MARGVERLSPLFPQKVREPGLFADGAGLYLQVVESAPDENGKRRLTKSWCFRFMLAGRAREMGLGAFHDYGLSDARNRARDARRLVREGIDPIEHRKAQMQARALEAARAITFKTAAITYIEAHKAEWTHDKSAEQWSNSLAAYAFPVFGDWPVATVDTDAVHRALDPIWTTKTVTAERVRGRIAAILDWAAVRGYRPKGPNPAAWVGNLKHSLPSPRRIHQKDHHAALPYTEAGAFMRKLRAKDAVSAKALQFLILTTTRTGETIGARWDEIDITAKTWTIPHTRMKGKAGKRRTHRVPLSDPALAILADMRKISKSAFVFVNGTGRFPIGTGAMDGLLRRMDIDRDVATVHGMRATFRTWAAERMPTVPREIAEMALAHITEDVTESSYQRSDHFERRRHLMDAWASYLAKPETSAEVVSIADHAVAG